MSTTPASGGFANIGKSVVIKGEISGNEDIYIDGQVEGSIQLLGNSLTVGPNGRVHASVAAKNVTVGGSLEGNIQASERTEMRKSAVVNGDVQTRRIAIEEGAYFKGKLEILGESKSSSSGASTVATSASAPNPNPNTPEPRK
jgi:cytoskeletal protein CcmA (bactofilin family)